ncbi:sensor histidine kinase [Alteraurantiacibacter palmitatis]|uniref:histidine kinase n=1 Tax=Alteraurantiacibacter palmitatis TaxID=2054628 RepID=A0ABV7E914_9SPHN
MSLPPFGSLRLRFMLAIGLWVMIGILGIWFTATQVFTRHIEQAYHEELEVHVRELARLTELDENGAPYLVRPLSDPRYEEPLSGFYWEVAVRGHPPLKSESMIRGELDQRVAHSPQIVHRIESGPTGPAITYGMIEPGPAGELVHIVIATDQRELDEDITAFTRELSVWLGTLALLLMATGLALVLFGLKPLDRLAAAINAVRGGKARVLAGTYPSEIAPLVNDLNAYIDQTGQLVDRARVQAGNLAHSLRTPLAVITDEAERMAEEPASRISAQVLLDQTQRMQQQIDYQLARARLVAAPRLPGERAELPQVLLPVLRAMERLHPDKRFSLRGFDDPVELPADPVNLTELLSILLDNAGKWAERDVTVTLHREADSVTLAISDDGPGLTEEQMTQAFAIGSRFDPAKPGSGLGLAMARDLAAALDADLALERRETGLAAVIRMELTSGTA